MMRLRVVSGKGAATRYASGADGLQPVANGEQLAVQGSGPARAWTGADGARYLVCGNVTGYRGADGSFGEPGSLDTALAHLESPADRAFVEGQYVLVRIDPDGRCELWTDRFGTVDLYYRQDGDDVIIASGLDLLPLRGVPADQIGFAHTLVAYGCRPAKQHTLFQGVRRLGITQGASLAYGRFELLERPFRAQPTAEYGERELHEYTDTLLEAIRARSSRYGNVVYLSSGWDSTSILACLVHLHGARKVRAVIGRMRYAERSGVVNQFELDRARAVADFYGVRLDVCEFDYRTGAERIVERVQPLFRAQQFASVTGLNHAALAEYTAATSGGDEVVFAGEMSDGAHNLGFSQFVTIFHPSLEFREYSDKMGSYLFGPTFLTQLQRGTYGDDVIWQLFRSRAGTGAFDEPAPDAEGRARQLLASFFLRGNRLPFWSLRNSPILTGEGRAAYAREMESTYLDTAAREVTPATLYSWYLHLYNSFHWQGSTVATLAHTTEANGLRCALPFHDGAMQDFLSAMPESWGRGLDLKPTKYPLKWMLQNRIRYPMHLQVGPHSYLYDVDHSFSHTAELLYGSSLGGVFRDRLRTGVMEEWLDPAIFDMDYVRGAVRRYLDGVEVRGTEMSDVLNLSMLATTGYIGGP